MDLTSPGTIREICAKFNFDFSKGLGQNFLLDKNVLEKIACAAEAENVLEIGPGFGCLTYELAEMKKNVVSVEIDKRLIPVLDYTLSEFDNVTIVQSDILKTDVKALLKEHFDSGKISVAANLPYYITTPIIAMLLELRLGLKNVVVMVQKEVAERICAEPGSKEYGAISVMCRYYSEPEIIEKVPAGSFMPPPKVDSAVLNLKIRDTAPVQPIDETLFFRVVKAAFAQRRKTLSNCLAHGVGLDKETARKALTECGFDPRIRGECLSVEDFAAVADLIADIEKKQ